MNRLFGGGKNKGSGATNLQSQKSKQVESLRKAGAIEILRDVEYRVVMSQGPTNITIFINLPAQFPSDKPILSVQPAVTHPWVDPQMKITGCPNINNFSMHSDLGLAVQAVMEEFKKTPPVCVPQHYILGHSNPTLESNLPPLNQPNQPTYANMPPYLPTSLPPSSQPALQQQPPPPLPPRYPSKDDDPHQVTPPTSMMAFNLPNVTSHFPALKDMKLAELQELVEDEAKITEMLQNVPDLVSFAQQRENLSTLCLQLARENLSKKPEIEQLRESVDQQRSSLEALQCDFEKHSEQHQCLCDQFHPAHIQTNLKVAVMEADEESEVIAESFLQQQISLDDFMKTFMEKRTLCHKRRAKEEKLSNILMAQGLQY